jgi:hypothetical protein
LELAREFDEALDLRSGEFALAGWIDLTWDSLIWVK